MDKRKCIKRVKLTSGIRTSYREPDPLELIYPHRILNVKTGKPFPDIEIKGLLVDG